jgi:hypothetical protein
MYIKTDKVIYIIFCDDIPIWVGHTVGWLVEAICYKLEGRGFESR